VTEAPILSSMAGRGHKPIEPPKVIRPKDGRGQRCTVCTHDDVKKINKLLVQGKSFMEIGRQFFKDEASDWTKSRRINTHATECMALSVAAIIQKNMEEQGLDVLKEFRELHQFARDLLKASRVYLSDPENPGEIVLIPQGTEIDVIYERESDDGRRGPKKRFKATLQDLLDRLQVKPTPTDVGKIVEVRVKHDDIRTFSLNGIRTAEGVLDKLARMGGLYQQERKNPHDVANIADRVAQNLIERGWTEESARAFVQERYPQVSEISDANN
jgi:hypothetical protein